jgi:hypothetical protein
LVIEGKSASSRSRKGRQHQGRLDRHDNLSIALAIYRGRVEQFAGRLVMLCDRPSVLARSDRML